MNVDEAITEWKRIREAYDWSKYSPTLTDFFVAEVERLRAEVEILAVEVTRLQAIEHEQIETQVELAAAKAASVISNDEQDCEQIAIKGMSHFYGDLWILHDGDEYFWRLDDYNGGEWQPISKQLYEALRDHNRQDRTPPAT